MRGAMERELQDPTLPDDRVDGGGFHHPIHSRHRLVLQVNYILDFHFILMSLID